MASKNIASVNDDRCVACGECVIACKREAISIYKGIKADVNSELCVGCGLCGNNCPALAIKVIQREEKINE